MTRAEFKRHSVELLGGAILLLTVFSSECVFGQAKVAYDRDIQPLMTSTCATASCHASQAPVLSDYQSVRAAVDKIIDVISINPNDPDPVKKRRFMPKGGSPLTPEVRQKITQWKTDGLLETATGAAGAATPPGGQPPTRPPGATSGPPTPLILALTSNEGYETCSRPVQFDFYGNGHMLSLSWPSPRFAFLVLDANGNGLVDDGRELFGTAMRRSSATLFENGFTALASFDADSDGLITTRDPVFQQLRLWQDKNCDGKSSPDELANLDVWDVAEIEVEFTIFNPLAPQQVAPGASGIWLKGSFQGKDSEGRTFSRSIFDIVFAPASEPIL